MLNINTVIARILGLLPGNSSILCTLHISNIVDTDRLLTSTCLWHNHLCIRRKLLSLMGIPHSACPHCRLSFHLMGWVGMAGHLTNSSPIIKPWWWNRWKQSGWNVKLRHQHTSLATSFEFFMQKFHRFLKIVKNGIQTFYLLCNRQRW